MKSEFKEGILLREFLPVDQFKKRNYKFYAMGSIFEINPIGIYIRTPKEAGLGSWFFKNLKTREMWHISELVEGVDYNWL
jgi:hypothetical protein